jgi:hypothetical protein
MCVLLCDAAYASPAAIVPHGVPIVPHAGVAPDDFDTNTAVGSACTHAPLQSWYPESHWNPHAPLVHVAVAFAGGEHAKLAPHPPQSPTFVCSSMQALPHTEYGEVQVNPHLPALQVGVPFAGAVQAKLAPHPPQSPTSVSRFTQPPLHSVGALVGQSSTQPYVPPSPSEQ